MLKLGDKRPRCSLGTDDKRHAALLTMKAYQAWLEDPNSDWRSACGNVAHHIGFQQVAEDWLATQKTDHAYKSGVIRKFLVPFFASEKHVTHMAMINQAMVDDYKLWRRDYWSRRHADTKISTKQAEGYGEPSATTLNREYPTLRQILSYAAKRGYMEKQLIPEVQAEASKPNPRPALLGGDFEHLMRETERWIAEAADQQTVEKRKLLADWIWINRYTGLRVPHEAEKLTWADIRFDVNLLYVAEDTKTGKREVPLRDEAASRLKALKKRHETAAAELTASKSVFTLPSGEKVNLSDMFNAVIERCKFPVRADQLPYSPYSLRATYATFSLAEGRSYEWLEEVMGTSIKMLKAHYKQGTIEQTQRYLRKKGVMPMESWGNASAVWAQPVSLKQAAWSSAVIGGNSVVLTADGVLGKAVS
ncbi:MAG TPA: tyrosine-type recombinase/integrase [Candidatus Sulfotelmatobacter sp.]|nr:tyrosine-type recombinase/integrase [Candidatus Sulfotelmatobacter sp.]